MLCRECDTPALARGLCMRCYQRRRRAGTLPPVRKRRTPKPPPGPPPQWESPLVDVLDALSPFTPPPSWRQVSEQAELLDDLGGIDLRPAVRVAEAGNLAAGRALTLATLDRVVR